MKNKNIRKHEKLFINSKYRQMLKTVLTLLLVIIVALFSINLYSDKVERLLKDSTEINLIEMAKQIAHTVEEQINSEIAILEAHVNSSFNSKIIEEDLKIKELEDFAKNNDYARIYLVDLNGKAESSDGVIVNFFDNPYFQLARKGTSNISKVFRSIVDVGQIYVAYFVPVIKDDKVIYVVAGTKTISNIENEISVPFYGGKGRIHIIDKSGEVVFHNRIDVACELLQIPFGKNYDESYEGSILNSLYSNNSIESVNKLLSDIDRNIAGTIRMNLGNHNRYVSYAPINGVHDWLVLADIEPEVVFSKSIVVINMTIALCIVIAVILISAYFYIILERKRNERHLLSEREVYKTVIEKNVDLVLEVDVNSNMVEFYISELSRSLFIRMFGEDAALVSDYDMHMDFMESRIHPDDKGIFAKMPDENNKLHHLSREYRFKCILDDEYIWIRSTRSIIKGINGKTKRIVISVININEQKVKEINLINAAEIDAMTGVFNKITTINKIDEYLFDEGRDGQHALLMIDIDNFKKINDAYGTIFGDQLIKKLSLSIKNSFYSHDVIGRVGGDEFVVLMKNYKNITSLKFKINKMLDYVYNKVDNDVYNYILSASVGISRYPEDGKVFVDLVGKSDLAMYQAKMLGKNTFCLYNDLTENALSTYTYTKDVTKRIGDLTLSFENSSEGMLLCYVDKKEIKCLKVNSSYLILHGIERGMVEGATISDSEEMTTMCEKIYACVDEKLKVLYTDKFVVSGVECVVESSISIAMHSEQIFYVIVTERDITEKIRREKESRKVIKEYNALFNSTYDGIVMVEYNEDTKKFTHTRANKKYCEIFEVDENVIEGSTLDEYLSEQGINMASMVIATGMPNNYICTRKGKQHDKFVLVNLVPYVDEANKNFLVLTCKDVTREHVLSDEKEVYAERFKAIIGDNTASIFVLLEDADNELMVVEANEHFLKLVDREHKDCKNMKLEELSDKFHTKIIKESFYEATRTKEPFFTDFYDWHFDKYYNYVAHPVFRNEDVISVIVSVRDITQIRQLRDDNEYLIRHDGLTGQYSRYYMENLLDSIVEKENLSITIMNIVGMNLLNEAFGMATGDFILKKAGQVIAEIFEDASIGRWGSDEFIIVADSYSEEEIKDKIKLVESFEYAYDDIKITIGFSIGTVFAEKSDMIGDLPRKALGAMNNHRYVLMGSKEVENKYIDYILNILVEKNHESAEHVTRMQEIAEDFGNEIGLTQKDIEILKYAARLHDIGKIGVPQDILSLPRNLTEDEMDQVRKHCNVGYRIAVSSKVIEDAAQCILCHHERYDGKGYPNNLKGEDIPYLARIINIIDSYEVMSRGRAYKNAMTPEEIEQELMKCSGSQFDPELVKQFIACIKAGKYLI